MTENLTSQWIAISLSALMLLVALPVSADTITEQQAIKAEAAEKQQPRIYRVQAVQFSMPVMTRRLDSLLVVKAWVPGNPIRFVPKRIYPLPALLPPVNQPTWQIDPLLEVQAGATVRISKQTSDVGVPAARIVTPAINILGQSFSGVFPPDTVGDIGPAHYVQAINAAGGSSIQGYDKSGAVVFGPIILSSLGSNICATGFGDPIVLYDREADRWLLSEFSGIGDALCVYISQTPDPGGTYFAYHFNTPGFPDYPKYAVWSDAYYVSTNEGFGSPVYALDRTAMLTGLSGVALRFTAPDIAGFGFQALTPVDLDGAMAPPAGTPGYFVRHRDDEVHNPGANNPTADFLEIWELDVDFATPANSTFTGPTNISITEFDSDLCGLVSFNCFPQPNGNRLDPLREVVMWRAQYRNFGTHQALVGNFTTDVSGTDRGGIRWFELRNSGGGWSLLQEGTYSPDTDNRWMGSIAMDQDNNIALGYSVVSPTQFTDIRYAGRLATDPAGTLPDGEHVMASGLNSQLAERWGDYSAMSVDPSDDCTFWYTNEYVTDLNQVSTRIASFKFPSCNAGAAPVCGDGVITSPEACDDLGIEDGDGCSSTCQVEPGFICTGAPSVCNLDPSETCLAENFEVPNQWTVFNTGAVDWNWGTTDDNVCWSGNLGPPPATNVTGGTGEAACVDSDAAGNGQVEAYLCTQQFLPGSGTIDLDFLYNYQIFGAAGSDDSFDVFVGTALPSAATIGGYTNVFSNNINSGSFAAPPGAHPIVDLTAFAGINVHICFGYRGDFDWYAQIDDVTVVASAGCGIPIDTDGDGIPDIIDPDDDDDGIGDALDTDPLIPSNSCTGGTQDDATLAVVVSTDLTCGARQTISVNPPTEVQVLGHLNLIAPKVTFQSGFKAGRLTVITTDACPGCSP